MSYFYNKETDMAELELISQEIERVALSIGIPPCPGILLELTEETKKEEPDFSKVEKLVSKDVGLSASLLKTINSPFYGLRNKISSVSQAVNLLGLSMLSSTISGLVLRNVFSGKDQVSMERFWDSSAKFALATMYVAKKVPGLNKDDAYTYGLFQNCGIPVLIQRFPDYKQTLDKANNSLEGKFTDIEDDAHGTDHATIGYLMTKSWNLPEVTTSAVRFHHDFNMLSAAQTSLSTEVKDLIALGLLADHAVYLSSGSANNFSLEWSKGGALALAQLGLSEADFTDICDEIVGLLE
jgi:HD-like signal output (HDOD) protein